VCVCVFALSLDSLFSLAPGGEENRAGKKTCQEQLISSGKIKATVSGPSSQSTGKELLSTSNQNTAWLDSHSSPFLSAKHHPGGSCTPLSTWLLGDPVFIHAARLGALGLVLLEFVSCPQC